MEGITADDIVRIADSLVATAILAIVVVMFVRGDLLSRLVYEKMTEAIVAHVVGDISTRILRGVAQMFKDWERDKLDRLE